MDFATRRMMRELGGVFGVAIAVAAGISLAGAAAGLALPGRARARRVTAVPALETDA